MGLGREQEPALGPVQPDSAQAEKKPDGDGQVPCALQSLTCAPEHKALKMSILSPLCLKRGQQVPAHLFCGRKAVCVNVLKVSIQQPKSNCMVAPQPLVMVLDNHEFSIVQWWPF